MGKEIKSKAISNWDSTNPIQASVVKLLSDPTKNGIVICNADGSPIVSWWALTGVGSPEWVINATTIGQLYMNTVVNIDWGYDCYIAVTTTGKRQQIFVSPNS